jgi:hypothetical protein
MYNIGFHVKLRPFLADFLHLLFVERKFRVYYYTAGTRSYGGMILDLLKMEITRLFSHKLD